MKKVDFTIKGTKLPTIPKGSMYGDYIFTRSYKNLYTKEYSNGIIYATSLDKDNNGFLVPVSLPLIERLAEEQGMLYEKEEEEERDWTGVRFRMESGNEYIIERGKNCYEVPLMLQSFTQEKVDKLFADGTWIEVAAEHPTPQPTPSLRDLLQQASVSEYIIRTGCQMFSGVDESERLKQVEQEWAKLREVVKQLDNILNEKK